MLVADSVPLACVRARRTDVLLKLDADIPARWYCSTPSISRGRVPALAWLGVAVPQWDMWSAAAAAMPTSFVVLLLLLLLLLPFRLHGGSGEAFCLHSPYVPLPFSTSPGSTYREGYLLSPL